MSLPTTNPKDPQPLTSTPDHTDQPPPPSYEPATTSSTSAPLPRPEDTTISSLPLTFPDTTAPASEIRTYIRSLLYHNAAKYDLEQADVIRIASAWRYGSGQELRSYDRATWEGLFGVELGAVLGKWVKDEEGKGEKERELRTYWGNVIGMGVTFSVFVLTIWLCMLPEDEELRRAAFIMATIVSFLPCGGFFLYFAIDLARKRYQLWKQGSGTKGDYERLVGEEDATSIRLESV